MSLPRDASGVFRRLRVFALGALREQNQPEYPESNRQNRQHKSSDGEPAALPRLRGAAQAVSAQRKAKNAEYEAEIETENESANKGDSADD